MYSVERFSGVRAFVAVAECGSFKAAAQLLGLTPSAISKAVTRLEAGLRVRLFQRTTRRLKLTADGEIFYRRSSQALAGLALADADAADIDQAIADGGFVLNDSTVVMRHNADNDQIEFFCDVGLPEVHAREAAYRAALEINLCRSYPGITLGVHPESGRMVATVAIHSLLVADDEVCLNTLELLTRQVGQLRASGAIALQAEA